MTDDLGLYCAAKLLMDRDGMDAAFVPAWHEAELAARGAGPSDRQSIAPARAVVRKGGRELAWSSSLRDLSPGPAGLFFGNLAKVCWWAKSAGHVMRFVITASALFLLIAFPSYAGSVKDALNAQVGDTVSVSGTTSNYYHPDGGDWSFDLYDDTATISVDTYKAEAKCAPGSTVSVTGKYDYDASTSDAIIRDAQLKWTSCVAY